MLLIAQYYSYTLVINRLRSDCLLISTEETGEKKITTYLLM